MHNVALAEDTQVLDTSSRLWSVINIRIQWIWTSWSYSMGLLHVPVLIIVVQLLPCIFDGRDQCQDYNADHNHVRSLHPKRRDSSRPVWCLRWPVHHHSKEDNYTVEWDRRLKRRDESPWILSGFASRNSRLFENDFHHKSQLRWTDRVLLR